MLEVVFGISAFGLFYAYFGYPIALIAATRLRGTVPRSDGGRPPTTATIIIAARNEEGWIDSKLIETIALASEAGAATKVQILVASDASDDGTDGIVTKYSASGVQLARLPERGGKERAQANALEQATGEIVIFTDAKVRLGSGSVGNFLGYFRDPLVGAVSSVDEVVGAGGSGEGLYVRYEMYVRKLEAKFESLVGLSGSSFAVRREICMGMRTDIPSDFSLLLRARENGYRGVPADNVVCSYSAVRSEEEEFGRKVRTVLRGITALFSSASVLNPFKFGVFSWQVASHKLMRWLVPWFFCLAFLTSLLAAPRGELFAAIALLFVAFAALSLAAFYKPNLRKNILFKVPLFFCVSNAAIAVAWYRYLRGSRAVFWTPSDKQR